MKQIMLAILTLMICTFANANSTTSATNNIFKSKDEEIFLRSLDRRIHLFQQMNLALLQRRNWCLSQSSIPKQCESDINSMRSFIQGQHEELRILLTTYNLLSGNNSYILLNGFLTQAFSSSGKWVFKLPIKNLNFDIPYASAFKNDVAEIFPLNSDFRQAAESAPLSILQLNEETGEKSMTDYDTSWTGYIQMNCREVATKHNISQNFCERLKLKYNSQEQYFYFSPTDDRGQLWQKPDLKEHGQLSALISILQAKTNAAAKDVKSRMYGLIQLNPYLALVETSNPSNQDLRKALQGITKIAETALHDFNQKSRADRKNYIELMGYSPVVQHLLNNPSFDMQARAKTDFHSIANQLDQEHGRKVAIRMGLQMAGVIGTVVACLSPIRITKVPTLLLTAGKVTWLSGKGLFVAQGAMQSRKTLRAYNELTHSALCISVPQVLINSYFIYEAYSIYTEVFGELFISGTSAVNEPLDLDGDGKISTTEAEEYEKYALNTRLLREVEELESAQSGVFWSSIFAPFGVYGTLKFVGQSSLKLSKGAIEHFDKKIPVVQNIINK